VTDTTTDLPDLLRLLDQIRQFLEVTDTLPERTAELEDLVARAEAALGMDQLVLESMVNAREDIEARARAVAEAARRAVDAVAEAGSVLDGIGQVDARIGGIESQVGALRSEVAGTNVSVGAAQRKADAVDGKVEVLSRTTRERFDEIGEQVRALAKRRSRAVLGGGGGSMVNVYDEGTLLGSVARLDFTGAGVAVSKVGDRATVDVSGGGGTVDVVSNVAQDRVLGRVSAGSGDSEELTAAQVRTLINVEDGATADQTAAEILAALATVDGAGSGLDADLLDGQSGAYYLAKANHTGVEPSRILFGSDEGTAVTDATPISTETTLLKAPVTLAGGTIGVGDVFEIEAGGTMTQNSGASRSYTFRVKVGATTVLTLLITTLTASATARPWRLIARVRQEAASDQNAVGQVFYNGQGSVVVDQGASTEDLSTDKAIDVTIQSSAGVATQSCQLTSMTVRKVAA
jgi:hypothetical protein